MNFKLIIAYVSFALFSYSQNVGINSTGAAPVSSAALDVDMTNKGILIPRVALTTTTAFAPVTGTATTSLLVFNTATAGSSPTNVFPGYYYWDGSKWLRVTNSNDGWNVTGNAGTVATNNFIGTIDNVDFVTRVNNTERMRVAASTGHVGIGTVSPSNRLTIAGGNVMITDAAGTGGFIQGFDEHHSHYFREGNVDRTNYYEYGGIAASGLGHRFLTGGVRSSQILRFQIADNAVCSYVPVGIGTFSPLGIFDVATNGPGNWSYFRSNVGGSDPSTSYTQGLAIGWNRSNGLGETNIIYSAGPGAARGLEFGEWNGVAYTARMKILVGSGHVGIGTMTPIGKLDVLGLHASAGSGTGAANDGPSQVIIAAGVNGTSRMNDWPGGWGGGISTYDICGASTFMSSYVTRSDIRLKNTIQKMNQQLLESFMQLNPVTYLLNEELPENKGIQYGFIAQEVGAIFPSLVTETTEDKGIIGMNYQGLIAPTVYVVQQQQAEIELLKAEVEALKRAMELLLEKIKTE
jgi:hypothetical protein